MSDLETARRGLSQHYRDSGLHHGGGMGERLAAGIANNPDLGLVYHSAQRPEATLTLAELEHRSKCLRRALVELDFERDDVICFQLPSWPEIAVLYLAAYALGLVVVPIVHIYGPHELGHVLRETGAKGIVIPDTWRNADYPERVAKARPPESLQHTIIVGDHVPDGCLSFAELESSAALDHVERFDGRELAMIVYTSGTQGVPKGVRHSHDTLGACVTTGPSTLSSEADPVNLFASSPGHIGGVIGSIQPFLLGVKGVYLDLWDPDVAAELVSRHRVTRSTGAPAHLLGLAEACGRSSSDTSSFWFHCCGGERSR